MSLKTDIFADYTAAVKDASKPNWARVTLCVFKYTSFRAAFLFRIGSWLRRRGLRIPAGIVGRLMGWTTGLDVGMTTEIGAGMKLPHPHLVVIGNQVKIGTGAYILQGVTIGGRGGRTSSEGQTQPFLGDDVLVGAGAKVIGPVTIGNRVKIGANAVVLNDLPDDAVAVGVPARVVRIGDKRIGLIDGDDELARLLRDFQQKIEALEAKLNA